MPTTTETLRVEVEMRARDAIQNFEKLDSAFRETAGANQALYKQLWREQKKYTADAEREQKQRLADEKWLNRELLKEEEARKKAILREAREERALTAAIHKETRERVKNERWLSKEIEKEENARKSARKGLSSLTSQLGNLKTILPAVGIGLAARELAQFGASSLKAAGDMDNLVRGLEFATGSASAAGVRFKELNELAKFPSLSRETLVQYDAQLQNMGLTAEQNNSIFLGLSKGISTFGGSMHDVSGSLLQLSQALDKGKIISQDFRPILERTRGTFLSTAKEVYNFTGGIEEMRAAHEASGKTLQAFLIPVFDRMAESMPGAEVDSYTNLMGNLGDATFNLQAAIGEKLLPIFKDWGSTLLDITERTTAFIEGEKTATENTENLADALNNTSSSLSSKRTAIEGYLETLDATSDKYFLIQGALAGYQEDIDELVGAQESHRQLLREVGADIVSLTEKQKTQSRVGKKEASEYRATTLALNQKLAAQKKLQAELDILNGVVATVTATTEDATEAAKKNTEAAANQGLELAKLKAAAADASETLSNTIDPDQVSANLQTALQASNTYYAALIASTQEAIVSSETSVEKRADLEVRLFELQRQQTQARTALEDEVTAVVKRNAEKQTEISERQTASRIEAAESARAVEVAGYERAGESGAAYAEQLSRIASPEQRQRFAEIVASFQAQGLSLEEARQRAEPYIDILNGIPPSVNSAKATYGNFISTISQESPAAATAIASMQTAVEAFGGAISDTALDQVKELTKTFNESSEEILHNWDLTVSDFERRLREAETEDALNEIEVEFDEAQQNMLESLTNVLTDLGFTADQSAEILADVFRNAETEADGFADKVIAAFKRLGKEVDRETKRQNKEAARSYQELTREIEAAFDTAIDFISDLINEDTTIEDAFGRLGERIGDSLLDKLSSKLSEQLAGIITDAADGTDGTGAGSEGLVGAATSFVGANAGALVPFVFPAIVASALAYGLFTRDDSEARARNAEGGDRLTQDEVRQQQGGQRGGERRGPDGTIIVTEDDGPRTATREGVTRQIGTGEAGRGGVASVSEGRRRREDAPEAPTPTTPFGPSTAQTPNLRGLTDVQSAYIQSLGFDPSAYGYDSRRNAFVKTAGGVGPTLLYDDSEVPDDTTSTERSTGTQSQGSASSGSGSRASTDSTPATVHRFTGAENQDLKTFSGTIKEKRTDFLALTDADFSTILNLYGEYGNAILDYYNAKMTFIQGASNIDAGAKGTAEGLALQEYNSLTYRANRDLEDVMSNNNLQLVNEFGATTGIIARNQVVKGVVHGQGSQGVVRADETKYKTVTSTSTPAATPLGERHRFSSSQSTQLKNMEDRAKQVRTDFRNLTDTDFSTILNKYGEYTALLQGIYDERIAFIDSTPGITEAAKSAAREAALIAFQNDTYEANQILSQVMGTSDLQLVNEFDTTTGIIPRGQVLKGVVHGEGRRGVVKADETKYKTVTSTSTPAREPTQPINNALLRNDVELASWRLDTSESEKEFEDNRKVLRQETVEFYDAEIERIKSLGLSIDEETDKLADNQLAREKALYRIDEMENKFETNRIKRENDAVKAQEKRESEAFQTFTKFKEDALSLTETYLQKEADLYKRHADKLIDIEKRRVRAFEDSRIGHFRNQEDIITATARRLFDEPIRGSSDLTGQQLRQVYGDTSFIENIADMRKNQHRFDQDLGISTGRSVKDAEQLLAKGLVDTTALYTEKIVENTTAMEMLTEQFTAFLPQTPTMQLEAPAEVIKPLLETTAPAPLNVQSVILNADQVVSGGVATPGGGGTPEQVNPTAPQQPIYVVVNIGGEQIVTPQLAEMVSDQLSVNTQNGVNRR